MAQFPKEITRHTCTYSARVISDVWIQIPIPVPTEKFNFKIASAQIILIIASKYLIYYCGILRMCGTEIPFMNDLCSKRLDLQAATNIMRMAFNLVYLNDVMEHDRK